MLLICLGERQAITICTFYCSLSKSVCAALCRIKAGRITWEVVAQPAEWGSADPCQVVAGRPPHAEGAAAGFPAGFLCERHKHANTRPGYIFRKWFGRMTLVQHKIRWCCILLLHHTHLEQPPRQSYCGHSPNMTTFESKLKPAITVLVLATWGQLKHAVDATFYHLSYLHILQIQNSIMSPVFTLFQLFLILTTSWGKNLAL